MYITPEEVVSRLQSGNQDFLIIDTRDEDSAGGNIKGALHLADSSDWSLSMPVLLSAIAEKKATMVIFHCMESIRRGPRCARRLHNYFLENGEYDNEVSSVPELRILQGGADQWIRKFYKTDLVEGYDDEYWAFEEFPPHEQRHYDDGEDGTMKNMHTHTLYSRPSDQHIDAKGNNC